MIMSYRYDVTLSDGHCFKVVKVNASNAKEACAKAFEKATEDDLICEEPFESSGEPQYVDDIILRNENGTSVWVDVPLEYLRMPDEIERIIERLQIAKDMVAKGHAEEAIMALENIPGLKGLGDLVRGVR